MNWNVETGMVGCRKAQQDVILNRENLGLLSNGEVCQVYFADIYQMSLQNFQFNRNCLTPNFV